MSDRTRAALRQQLQSRKQELLERLEKITANVRRGFEADSEERAKQMEDSEVVDALGNDARAEIARISITLRRIESGEYGVCSECGSEIDAKRLAANPYALACIDCAEYDEHRRAHSRT